jgi:hypothetical protein
MIECLFTGTLKCPEGSFPVHVGLKGGEGVAGAEGAGAGRQWQIAPTNTGYVQWAAATRTPYGYYVAELERRGGDFADGFRQSFLTRPGSQYLAYKGYVEPGGDPSAAFQIYDTAHARAAVAGALAGTFALPTEKQDAYLAAVRDRLFQLPGGGVPSGDQKKQFQQMWERGGILPPGYRIRNSSDTVTTINVTDSAVEVRLPVELPIPGDELSAARGRIVVACTDPKVLGELKQLRAAAEPDKASSKADEFRDRTADWRVIAIEADMVKVQQQRGPRDPGAMDGPPGY